MKMVQLESEQAEIAQNVAVSCTNANMKVKVKEVVNAAITFAMVRATEFLEFVREKHLGNMIGQREVKTTMRSDCTHKAKCGERSYAYCYHHCIRRQKKECDYLKRKKRQARE